MQIEEAVIDALKHLPVDKKIKVLKYTKSLGIQKAPQSTARKSIIGSLSHLNIKFTEEDLRAARREMWPSFYEDDDK